MILAGDIGGTNCRLALFDEDLSPVTEKTFPSRDFPDFTSVVKRFKQGLANPVRVACFGIPGPVHRNAARVTNLRWEIDGADLAREAEIPAVKLINDLEGFAYGLEALQEDEFLILNPAPEEPHAGRVVLAAGTGLGEAGVVWDGSHWLAVPTEGGHADFAPQDVLQEEMLAHYRKAEGKPISFEFFLSGPGLRRIFGFLKDVKGMKQEDWLAEEMEKKDPSAAISKAGMEGKSPLASQALDVFCAIYGAEAGNMALKYLAKGGVFLAGGIAPAIAARLDSPVFMKAFMAKSKMERLLETIPVKIVLNDKAGMLGAARYARERM